MNYSISDGNNMFRWGVVITGRSENAGFCDRGLAL